MPSHHDRPERERSDRITRRRMLQVGLLGGLGLSLPQLLRHEARGESDRFARAKSVIFLWLQGGVSHHETFDMKPEAPADIRGPFSPIRTNLPGVFVGEHLVRLSRMMDKLAVIRSVTHGESAHERGSQYMVSGRRPVGGPSLENTYPDIGAIVGHQLGMRNGLPPYVSVPGNDFTSKFTGPGYLPRSAGAFKGTHAVSLKFSADVSPERFQERVGLRTGFDSTTREALGDPSWDEFNQRAVDIITSAKASQAFDFLKESDETLKLYGIERAKIGKTADQAQRLGKGEYCLMTRRLVEAGVRFVTIGRDGWDHHSNIFPQLKGRLPRFDAALAGLITDLEQRGLLDETLVVYLTEFGRTPKINNQAGRDHWPGAFSVAFAGAGIQTGQVLGASDKHGAHVVEFPVSPEEIAATILSLVGIDPQTTFTSRVDGRPIFYVEKARPVQRLLT